MAEDSSLPNIGGNGFIWILLVAAGTYFVAQQQVPLQGSRPASTERRVGEQLVDARLWQDPFTAVADYLAKSPSLKPENCDGHNGRYKDIETYCRPPATGQASEKATPDALPNLTLVVSVSGAPYWEDQEARRRKRYAVLAGLNAEGFVPDDPQHIGFFWPDPGVPIPASPSAELTASPPSLLPLYLSTAPPPSVTLPKTIPYEWFRPNPEHVKGTTSEAVEAKKGYRILLLWFDEDALAANAPGTTHAAPLRQFAKLLCPYLPAKETPDKVNVKIFLVRSSQRR